MNTQMAQKGFPCESSVLYATLQTKIEYAWHVPSYPMLRAYSTKILSQLILVGKIRNPVRATQTLREEEVAEDFEESTLTIYSCLLQTGRWS